MPDRLRHILAFGLLAVPAPAAASLIYSDRLVRPAFDLPGEPAFDSAEALAVPRFEIATARELGVADSFNAVDLANAWIGYRATQIELPPIRLNGRSYVEVLALVNRMDGPDAGGAAPSAPALPGGAGIPTSFYQIKGLNPVKVPPKPKRFNMIPYFAPDVQETIDGRMHDNRVRELIARAAKIPRPLALGLLAAGLLGIVFTVTRR